MRRPGHHNFMCPSLSPYHEAACPSCRDFSSLDAASCYLSRLVCNSFYLQEKVPPAHPLPDHKPQRGRISWLFSFSFLLPPSPMPTSVPPQITPEDRIIAIELGDCALVRTQGLLSLLFFAHFSCLSGADGFSLLE